MVICLPELSPFSGTFTWRQTEAETEAEAKLKFENNAVKKQLEVFPKRTIHKKSIQDLDKMLTVN